MKRLWAPWRSGYLRSAKNKKCIFCGNKTPGPKKRYVLERSLLSFAMLNLYPYNNAHIMIAPYRHAPSLESLSDAELLDLFKLVNTMKVRIDKKLKPHGYNIGLNIGSAGGAGFAGHLHVHLVPRWSGDTNFMPVAAGTKVISQSLDAAYRLLKKNAKT